jgi:hypothetical protein
MREVRFYFAIFFVNVSVSCLAYKFVPSARSHLIEEDYLIENISALMFAGAFLFSSGLLWRAKRQGDIAPLLLIAVVGLVSALDELDWGRRIFGFRLFRAVGINIGSLHDLFQRGYFVILQLGGKPLSLIAVLASSTALILLSLALLPKRIRCMIAVGLNYPPYVLIATSGVLILSALVIDLDLVEWAPLFLFEELFEMNAALALLVALLALFRVPESRACPCYSPR